VLRLSRSGESASAGAKQLADGPSFSCIEGEAGGGGCLG
jgi:hypothetical protein